MKLVVIACGTATSQALEEVKDLYNIPIVGVITPTVNYIKETGKKQIGVIATAGTIRSKGWENAIINAIDDANVQSIACPLLAPMVEEEWNDNKIAELAINEYLQPFNKIDLLILGCTHYPLLKKEIQKIYPGLNLIDPATETALDLKKVLPENNAVENKGGHVKFYVSDGVQNFRNIGSMFLDEEIEDIELIKL